MQTDVSISPARYCIEINKVYACVFAHAFVLLRLSVFGKETGGEGEG